MIELFIDGGELFNLAAQTLHLLTLVVTTAVTYQQLLTQRNPAAQESLGIEPSSGSRLLSLSSPARRFATDSEGWVLTMARLTRLSTSVAPLRR